MSERTWMDRWRVAPRLCCIGFLCATVGIVSVAGYCVLYGHSVAPTEFSAFCALAGVMSGASVKAADYLKE